MATLDTQANNSRAADFGDDYGNATLDIREGTTVLASHTLAGFGAPSNGRITANAIPDVTIDTDGTADNAVLSSSAGTVQLTAGKVGDEDIVLDTTTFIAGETSSITSFSIDFS